VRPDVNPARPALRLHRGGQFRRWLASAFGRPEAEANEIWRRLIHGTGALVLVYYLLPPGFFVVVPNAAALLLALGAVVVLEGLRLGLGVELPTLRAYEAHRPASYVFYAVGLAAAVLLFPPPIAAAVVLGTAFVDPLAGELRRRRGTGPPSLVVPWAVYTALATAALVYAGRWPWELALGLGGVGAGVAVAVERWRFRWLDDDLTMTVAPALVLYALAWILRGRPL
jgi:hypothetical protein